MWYANTVCGAGDPMDMGETKFTFYILCDRHADLSIQCVVKLVNYWNEGCWC